METNDILIIIASIVVGFLLIGGIAAMASLPTELENGCIVYGDKVYCEEVNEVGG